MTNLFVKLFRDSLSEYSYQAELAELDYELAGSMFNSTRLQSIYGLTLTFSGFNDKMGVFLNSFFESPKPVLIFQKNTYQKEFLLHEPSLLSCYILEDKF